jgi:hypothetical protein
METISLVIGTKKIPLDTTEMSDILYALPMAIKHGRKEPAARCMQLHNKLVANVLDDAEISRLHMEAA